MGITKKILGVYKRYGFFGFCAKLGEKINSPMSRYTKEVTKYLPTKEELLRQKKTIFLYEPYVSIVIPAYETKEEFLMELLTSIQEQTYQKIELCIADASSSDQVLHVIEKVKEQWNQTNPFLKIQYRHLEKNAGISNNTNEGISLTTGDYIGFMDHDDILEKNAVFEVVSLLNEHKGAQFIYSDEDKVSYDLKTYTQPHFKPDFNLELIRDNNYICHFTVVSKELLHKVKGLRSEYDGSQDYDFVLRCIEETNEIYHIPKILYHWRMHAASTAGDSDSKTYTFDAGQRAIEDHLKRLKIRAKVEKRIEVGCFHIRYEKPNHFKKEDYFLQREENVKPITKDWEEELYGYCAQEKVGIVGAKVYTKDGKIKQNGYTFSKDMKIRANFCGLKKSYKGYVRRAVLAQDLSVVSFDFAMINRKAFEEVGGFDKSLPRPYRELDFCLKLKKAGYRVVQDPFVEARETKKIDQHRMLLPVIEQRAQELIFKKYKEQIVIGDTSYNPNLSQEKNTFFL